MNFLEDIDNLYTTVKILTNMKDFCSDEIEIEDVHGNKYKLKITDLKVLGYFPPSDTKDEFKLMFVCQDKYFIAANKTNKFMPLNYDIIADDDGVKFKNISQAELNKRSTAFNYVVNKSLKYKVMGRKSHLELLNSEPSCVLLNNQDKDIAIPSGVKQIAIIVDDAGLDIMQDIMIKSNIDKLSNIVVSANKLGDLSKHIKVNSWINIKSHINLTISGPKAIDKHAFMNCAIFKNIVIENVKYVGERAFTGNPLSTVSISNNGDLYLYSSCFEECKNLKAIALKANKLEIGERAFIGCKEIDNLYNCIDANTVIIKEKAFQECSNIQDIYIKANKIELYNDCFRDCKKIKSVEFYGNVSIKGNNIWSMYTKIEDFVITGDIDKIPKGLFNKNSNIKRVHISGNVGIIEDAAFENCDSLKEVYIDGNVGTLGKFVFANCNNIETFCVKGTIGNKIHISDFLYCDNLKNLSINDTELNTQEYIKKYEDLPEMKQTIKINFPKYNSEKKMIYVTEFHDIDINNNSNFKDDKDNK